MHSWEQLNQTKMFAIFSRFFRGRAAIFAIIIYNNGLCFTVKVYILHWRCLPLYCDFLLIFHGSGVCAFNISVIIINVLRENRAMRRKRGAHFTCRWQHPRVAQFFRGFNKYKNAYVQRKNIASTRRRFHIFLASCIKCVFLRSKTNWKRCSSTYKLDY